MIENLQREDLNPMVEAEGYHALVDQYGLTQEQAAQRVGKSRSAVANALRLLSLAQPVRDMVEAGVLFAGHARALLPLSTELQEQAASTVAASNLSVRQTEQLVKRLMTQPKEKPKKDPAAVTTWLRRSGTCPPAWAGPAALPTGRRRGGSRSSTTAWTTSRSAGGPGEAGEVAVSRETSPLAVLFQRSTREFTLPAFQRAPPSGLTLRGPPAPYPCYVGPPRPHTPGYFLYGQKVTKKPHRGGTLSMGSLPYEPHPRDDTKGATPPLDSPQSVLRTCRGSR